MYNNMYNNSLCLNCILIMHVMTVRVEIKDYSIVHFNCIAAFKVPHRFGRAHTYFIDA